MRDHSRGAQPALPAAHAGPERGEAVVTVHSLTRREMDDMINSLNRRPGTRVSTLSEGQLRFATDMPRMSLYGREQHPERHQRPPS